uniref:Uncharacterized protein n=1 Tax=Medinilla magnifica TaxID=1799599 RepID=A0A7D9MX23_9MYRT|nr:hypothetical protein [Medinilla magnifica]
MNILRPLSPHLRGRVFSLLIFFGVLGFSSVFLQLLGINFDMLLGALFHRILVHLVVSRFGWYSGGFLLAMVFVGLDLENKMMMAPSGENCDKEVTSSSSWNWRKCLNLSSDTEENKTPGPQAPPLLLNQVFSPFAFPLPRSLLGLLSFLMLQLLWVLLSI